MLAKEQMSSSMSEHYPYLHPDKRYEYGVESTRLAGGELQEVMAAVDELLYNEQDTVIRPHAARTSKEVFTSYFSYSYDRCDLYARTWSLENIRLNAEHTMYLGSAALKQCYKIQLQSSISSADIGKNHVRTLYYLEQVAGEGGAYSGRILRPNILGEENLQDDQMTVYDCLQLRGELAEIISLADVDARERSIVF